MCALKCFKNDSEIFELVARTVVKLLSIGKEEFQSNRQLTKEIWSFFHDTMIEKFKRIRKISM